MYIYPSTILHRGRLALRQPVTREQSAIRFFNCALRISGLSEQDFSWCVTCQNLSGLPFSQFYAKVAEFVKEKCWVIKALHQYGRNCDVIHTPSRFFAIFKNSIRPAHAVEWCAKFRARRLSTDRMIACNL